VGGHFDMRAGPTSSWLARLLAVVVSALPASRLHAAVILQYHHVSVDTPPSTSTSPQRFAMHLDYLAQHGFRVVPLFSLVEALQAGGPLPDRAVAITFDDGYRSIYETAYPMLRERGLPFTVFVNSAPHDGEQAGFMSWAQLRELSRNGATVANHSVSHAYLWQRQPGQDDRAWRDWATEEVSGAARRIEQEIGAASHLFAYPYGEYDAALLDLIAELGYTGFGQQSGPLAADSDLRALPRFPMGGSYGDAADFAVKVNSLPLPLDDRETDRSGTRPVLRLRLTPPLRPADLTCFASGQGSIPVLADGPWAVIQAPQPLPAGRSRYNCTARSSEPGRFHWFSQPWVNGAEEH